MKDTLDISTPIKLLEIEFTAGHKRISRQTFPLHCIVLHNSPVNPNKPNAGQCSLTNRSNQTSACQRTACDEHPQLVQRFPWKPTQPPVIGTPTNTLDNVLTTIEKLLTAPSHRGSSERKKRMGRDDTTKNRSTQESIGQHHHHHHYYNRTIVAAASQCPARGPKNRSASAHSTHSIIPRHHPVPRHSKSHFFNSKLSDSRCHPTLFYRRGAASPCHSPSVQLSESEEGTAAALFLALFFFPPWMASDGRSTNSRKKIFTTPQIVTFFGRYGPAAVALDNSRHGHSPAHRKSHKSTVLFAIFTL